MNASKILIVLLTLGVVETAVYFCNPLHTATTTIVNVMINNRDVGSDSRQW
jgi:hypothetical protein